MVSDVRHSAPAAFIDLRSDCQRHRQDRRNRRIFGNF